MINFTCEHCGKSIRVKDEYGGKKGRCPHCKEVVHIPAESEAPPESARETPDGGGGGRSRQDAAADFLAGMGGAKEEPPAEAPKARPETPGRPAIREEPPAKPGTTATGRGRRPQAPVAPVAGEAREKLPVPAAQINALLKAFRGRGGRSFFEKVETAAYYIVAYGLLVIGPLLVILGVVTMIQDKGAAVERLAGAARRGGLGEMFGYGSGLAVESFLDILEGNGGWGFVAMGVVLLIGQYIFAKLRNSARRLIEQSPSSLSSTALPDCVAALAMVLGVVVIALGLYEVVEAIRAESLLGGLTAFGAILGGGGLLVGGVLAMNPGALNVSVRAGTGVAAEALGLASFLLKLALRFAVVFVGVLLVWAAFMIASGAINAARAESILPLLGSGGVIGAVLLSGISTFVAVYLVFLLYHLVVDLARAVFDIAANTKSP